MPGGRRLARRPQRKYLQHEGDIARKGVDNTTAKSFRPRVLLPVRQSPPAKAGICYRPQHLIRQDQFFRRMIWSFLVTCCETGIIPRFYRLLLHFSSVVCLRGIGDPASLTIFHGFYFVHLFVKSHNRIRRLYLNIRIPNCARGHRRG